MRATVNGVPRSVPMPLGGVDAGVRELKRAANDSDGPLVTAQLTFSAGAAVLRFDYYRERPYLEQLVVDKSAIRMGRLERGAPLLNTHSGYALESILGVVDSPAIEGGQATCVATFSRRDSVAGYVQDVDDGVIRNVSVGYVRHRVEMVPPEAEGGLWVYRVTDWEPFEVSLVPIPADMDAQVRAADGVLRDGVGRELRTFPCEFVELAISTRAPAVRSHSERTMEETEVLAQRAAEITDLCVRHGVANLAAGLIRGGGGVDAARTAVLAELASRDAAAGGHLNIVPQQRAGQAARELMVDALAARMGAGSQESASNPYRHARLVDIARECLEARGVSVGYLSPGQVIERALHTTSDFPQLLQASGQRTLRLAYGSYQGGLKRVCRPSTAVDFRAKQRLMLGEAPALLKVSEHGEFQYGSMAESKEAYALATYGRIFGITRQALVNDDLEAFADMAVRLGRAAAEFEAKFLVTLLTSNPTMNDSVALFHADHGNLATGAGSALQLSSLTAARKAMRLQTGLDGTTPIDATPKFLIVPAALETTAEQLIATLVPNTISEVNPFSQKLDLVVDPRLDAVSATAWYLSSDPTTIDTIEYAYLEQAGGPEVISREGFEIDGVEMKVRLDYGAGVLDWRGMYKAAGA